MDDSQNIFGTGLTEEELASAAAAVLNGLPIADALNFDPKVIEGLYAFGHSLYQANNFRDAATIFQSLCLFRPEEPRFWMGLAGSRQGLEEYQAAVDAYSAAGACTGLCDPQPFFFAALCFLKLGKTADAMNTLECLLAFGDEAVDAHKVCHEKARHMLTMLQARDEGQPA